MTAIGDSRTIGTAEELAAGELPALEAVRRRRGPRWRAVFAAFLLTLVAAALVAAAFVVGLARLYDGRIVGGVAIHGVPVGGLDGPAAEARLRATLAALDSGTLTLVADGERRQVGYGAIGRDYDLSAMVGDAFAVGRTGEPLLALVDELRSIRSGTAVGPRVGYDRGALERLVAEAGAAFQRPATDASAIVSEDGSVISVTPGIDGRSVDMSSVVGAVGAHLASTDPGDLTVTLQSGALEPSVTTAEVEAAVASVRVMASQPLQIVVEGKEVVVPPEKLQSWLIVQPTEDGSSYGPGYVVSRMRRNVESMASGVSRAPQNAVFVTRGGRTIGYLASVDGREVDVQGTLARIRAELEGRAAGATPAAVEWAVSTTRPALTSEEAALVAPRMSRLGAWTTPYTPSIKNFFGRNITIPTNVIDGIVLAPGEWFDFWRAIGRVSVDSGYGPGGVIRNGRTDPTGALAGGICSCSTTIFNAAARAGLQLGERHAHWYYITRYPVGLDATVFRSPRAVQNMTFRNDTGHPILIRGINGYGSVRFEIYGVDTGRRTTFSSPIIRNRVRASDGIQLTSSLPTGRRERIEWPADGFDVWVTRTVRDGSGRIIHQQTFYSHYGRVNGIVLVGR